MHLHVPSRHNGPEHSPQPELHSRALQEGGALPSPKVPTFSVFSALHDSVLGEVRATIHPPCTQIYHSTSCVHCRCMLSSVHQHTYPWTITCKLLGHAED